MKKRLDTENISNELKGASLFFQRPSQDPRQKQSPVTLESPALEDPTSSQDTPRRIETALPPSNPGPTPVRPSGTPDARTPVRRKLTRMPFEFYQDQLDRLRDISLRAKLEGEKGSMSEMVREAVDRYLAEKHPE